MVEWRITSFVPLFFVVLIAFCSQVDLTFQLLKLSSTTFYITSLKDMQGITVKLTVSYQTTSANINKSVVIYSSSIVLTQKDSKFAVWNFEANDFTVNINLVSQADLTQRMLWMETAASPPVFVAVFDKDTSSGYMLPFNMLDQKIQDLYVIAFGQPAEQSIYNLEPYMSTYWTQKKSSIQLIPHFPYLSQCSFEKSFVLLNDLLETNRCQIEDFFGLQCQDKNMDFECILEELEVSNVNSEFWFNNDKSILFYIFPNKLSLPDLQLASQNLKGINSLILALFDDLVPVYYQRHSTDKIVVNDFHIQFKVTINMDSQMQMRIVYADIKGQYNPLIPSPKAQIHVQVHYLNYLQRFNSYDVSAWWYLGYAIILGVLISVCIYAAFGKAFSKRMRNKIQQVLAPAIKGCLYTTITGGCFFVLVNQITFQTNFSSVTALYGDTLTDEAQQLNNIGRNGFAVVLTGVYLMIASLKQACKVSSTEELKIVFEDDCRLERRGVMSEEQLAEKIEFTRKNMVSHEKFMLVSCLFVTFMGFWYIYFVLSMSNMEIALITVLVVPIVSKIFTEKMKHLIIKELLYISGNLLSLVLISTLLVLKNHSVIQFTYLYFSRFLNIYVEIILIELTYGKLLQKLDAASESNRLTKLLSKLMHNMLELKRRESEFERGIYLSSLIVMEVIAVVLLPLVALVLYLLSRTNVFQSHLLMGEMSSGYSLLMMLALMPMELLAIFALMELMKKQGVRIEEVIKFNHFRFRRRQFRWMNDEFSHSRNIQFFYRQYQKFAFSSQLYFVVSLLGFSGFLLYLGMLIIVQAQYMLVNDPVVLVMVFVIVILGDVLSIVVSFAAIKLRLYQKKEEEAMRQNLLKTEKYLKNNDITDFLNLQGVKDYFLLYNREWIVHNLPRIFDKDDFEENAGELVTKYKHYKSLFKKQQIDEKRRIKRLKENQVMAPEANLPAQAQLALPKHSFEQFARPLATYWLYLARQNLHLRAIVASVRKDKMLKNCEFCNMDVELQALQRRDFQQLVNQFRLLNVNSAFDSRSFLEFYRLSQKYVTICVECKEKNLHLENKITMKEIPSKLVKRWHLIAKSYLLHRNNKSSTH